MAVVHPLAIRNSLVNYIVDLIDGGTSHGLLVFQTSGDVEVATLSFGDPAFAAAADGEAAANEITPDSNATGGTIAKARIYDSDDGVTPKTELFGCSVTTVGGGGDIEFNSVVISAGQQVSMSSLTYTAPA